MLPADADKFGRQTVEVTVCINVAEVLADRVDYGRFSGAVSEIDLEPVRPPPEWVGGPADGHEFRAAVAFFRAHHARRRAADPSLPERCLALPYGLWSDGVQMSRWSGTGLHPVCLYIMSYRDVIRFKHDNIVRLGYIPSMVHPCHVSPAGHPSHSWSKDKWHQVIIVPSLVVRVCRLVSIIIAPAI